MYKRQGYGFAIPTSIMTKVIADLKQYGTVQRALLGIRGGSIGSSLMDGMEMCIRDRSLTAVKP